MNLEEKMAAAEERRRKAERYHDQLVRVSTAEAEIPGIWDVGQGQGLTMKKLAEQYNISLPTVRRILRDAGRPVSKWRKLTDDERAEVVALLRQGSELLSISQHYGVSINSVRRIGKEAGIIRRGRRRPKRSDEEYALIEAFDQEARARFNGAGLYNLGLGLRSWKRRKELDAAYDEREESGESHSPLLEQLEPSGSPAKAAEWIDDEVAPEPQAEAASDPDEDPIPWMDDPAPAVKMVENFGDVEPDPQYVDPHPEEPTPEVAQGSEEVPIAQFGDGIEEDAPKVAGPFANQAKGVDGTRW